MPTRTPIPRSDYTLTREEVLAQEQRISKDQLAYVRQRLIETSPRLLKLIGERVELPGKGCTRTTEQNTVNGVQVIKLLHPRAKIRLESRPPHSGDLCLTIDLVVDGTVKGTWKMRHNPSSGGNPLIVEYIEGKRVITLATGRRLNLNGLTDKTIQRSLCLDDHIVNIVQAEQARCSKL